MEDLGLDSIMYVKLLTSLKQKLGVDFEVNDLVVEKNQTIQQLSLEIAHLIQTQKRITQLEQLPKVKNLLERHAQLVERNGTRNW